MMIVQCDSRYFNDITHLNQCYRYQKDTKRILNAQYMRSVPNINLWPLTLTDLILLSEHLL